LWQKLEDLWARCGPEQPASDAARSDIEVDADAEARSPESGTPVAQRRGGRRRSRTRSRAQKPARGHREDSSSERSLDRTEIKEKVQDSGKSTTSSRPPRKGWDVKPDMIQLLTQQKIMGQFLPKKRRECYFGNLTMGVVTQAVLWQAVSRLFDALPAFHERYPELADPVVSVAFPTGGQEGAFAFVQFFDEVLASTAVLMNGFELCGRSVKVGRPMNYQPAPGGELPPLDVEPLRKSGVLPWATIEASQPLPVKTMVSNRLRELYFGNLRLGKVTEATLVEFVTPVCERFPEYDPSNGPVVPKVQMAPSGMFGFVEFQNPEMASRARAIFDGMEFFGRKLIVARPSNYQLSVESQKAQAALASAGAKANWSIL